MKRTMAVVFVLVVSVLGYFTLNPMTWQTDVVLIGGEFVANDEANRPCAWFEKDKQLICFSVFKTWLGYMDAVPVYVIEKGRRTELFADR